MMANPWLKFWTTDWRSDPGLRLCSRAARGTWIDMLSIMHEAEPYGELRVNGIPLNPNALAKLLGEDADDIAGDLDELEWHGVFSRRKNGIIFSRRMEKDENRRRKMRANGKLGGNPSLLETTEKPDLVIQEDKTQKPEARSQKPEKKTPYKTPPRSRSDPDADLVREFNDAFWVEYPHKVGKPDALMAFIKARTGKRIQGKPPREPVSLTTIMDGLRTYKETKPPTRSWLNPASFLNGEHYHDEPAEVDDDEAQRELPKWEGPKAGNGGVLSQGSGLHREDSEGREAGPVLSHQANGHGTLDGLGDIFSGEARQATASVRNGGGG